jgi:hypothetical protein
MTETKEKIMVIGFSGKIGSGKDYISKNIFLPMLKKNIKNINALFLAFADPLKKECALRYGCEYNKLYQDKDLFTRKSLQDVGTEFREKYGNNIYVDAMKMDIQLHYERSNINLFIIPDVRYPIEKKFIEELGGKVYRVTAPQISFDMLLKECNNNLENVKERSEHLSETALDKENFDGYIFNYYKDNPTENYYLEACCIISSF